ncbi:hypothetical protein LOTGIDRAFT_165736 [Lottia gigantea]|uniref:Endothelin-converting enzyme 1 n=1 Tax=Lottia gigantea TaxID=225164 RepID=V4A047_LOTGI|nr:hypothetical protein LOTGIDRAFT_165736 [Lottia gigantea]ESO88295.1 hypothetical protein LOTGIDRAFT_165736 [Lottia gigantea]
MCTTTDCVRVASRIHDAIDYKVKPCDNFYEFACGTWKKKNVIPEDKSAYSSFDLVADDVNVILKNALEDKETEADIEPAKKAKRLYRSCLDTEKIESLGTKPLDDFIPKIGGWPVLMSSWSDAGFDLKDLLVTLAKYNNWPLISLSVYTDMKNVDKNILYLDQPSLGMPGQKYYFKERNDTMIMAYENLAVQVATMLGADKTVAEQDMKDMVDFEILIANISVPSEERRDSEKLYNKMTIAQLAQNYSEFDWLGYINSIMSSPKIQIDITEDEEIINYSPPYFDKLFSLLNNTPKRTLANYCTWRIVRHRISSLGKAFRDLNLEYSKVLYGTSTESARWKKCVGKANSILGKVVGKIFVGEAFDEAAKADMLKLIGNLKVAFEGQLFSNDWMDESTRKAAKEKYTITEDEYFSNIINFIQESVAEDLRELRKPIDKTKWSMVPSAVNAYYSSTRNEIVFPAGILQPPFYHKNYLKALNYGGIGMVIGHEITHGFDDQGRQYDKTGSLRQWWSDDVVEVFKTRAQCVIEQYGNFTVKEADLQINGINTQGENIADNGAITQSFKAYRHWVSQERNEEPKLPGLDFSPNQLFFINFAQVWCNSMRKQSAISRVLTGVHSPGKFRVIGTLQNSPDFAKTFGCPVSSYMNPEKKCKVW